MSLRSITNLKDRADAIQAIALEFDRLLREEVSPATYEGILRANADPRVWSAGCCVVHAFCDPNMLLLQAYHMHFLHFGAESEDFTEESIEDMSTIHAFWHLLTLAGRGSR